MATTKRTGHDFPCLPSKTFRFTLTAPNGDKVEYPNLDGHQAEQLWRFFQANQDSGWDVRWAGNGD